MPSVSNIAIQIDLTDLNAVQKVTFKEIDKVLMDKFKFSLFSFSLHGQFILYEGQLDVFKANVSQNLYF